MCGSLQMLRVDRADARSARCPQMCELLRIRSIQCVTDEPRSGLFDGHYRNGFSGNTKRDVFVKNNSSASRICMVDLTLRSEKNSPL
jgi:hypothetical protein